MQVATLDISDRTGDCDSRSDGDALVARTVARADWGLREVRHNKLPSEVAASELSASEHASSGTFRTEVSERTFRRRAAPRLARGGGLVGIVKVAHVTGGGGRRTHGRRCVHGRRRYTCRDCGGRGICAHGRQRNTCTECGGSSICAHGRRRYTCKECEGGGICAHGRQRYNCKECEGSGICVHGRQRYRCGQCRGLSAHKSHRSKCKKNGGSSGI